MSLIDSITSLRTQLDNAELEIKSLAGGKKIAGPRARRSLQNIKNASHSLRKSITDHTKGMVTKPRVKKEILCATHLAVECGNISKDAEDLEDEVEAEAEAVVEPVKVKRVRKPKVVKS
jgi:hypothetical protein